MPIVPHPAQLAFEFDTPPIQKTCTKCGATKGLESFCKQKDGKYGHTSRCFDCMRVEGKRWYYNGGHAMRLERALERRKQKAAAPPLTERHCTKCKQFVAIEHFRLIRMGARGRPIYNSYCRPCDSRQKQEEYAKDRDRLLAAEKARRTRYTVRKSAYTKAYAKAHPEVGYKAHRTRRNLLMNCEGSHTLQEWLDLCARYNYCCLACGVMDVELTEDHVVPLSKGGSDDIGNIQPLCRSCNCKKHVYTHDYRPHVVVSDN